jgi:hypothetical protein
LAGELSGAGGCSLQIPGFQPRSSDQFLAQVATPRAAALQKQRLIEGGAIESGTQ